MVEYALILVLIAIVVHRYPTTVGHQVNNVFSNISQRSQQLESSAPFSPTRRRRALAFSLSRARGAVVMHPLHQA